MKVIAVGTKVTMKKSTGNIDGEIVSLCVYPNLSVIYCVGWLENETKQNIWVDESFFEPLDVQYWHLLQNSLEDNYTNRN